MESRVIYWVSQKRSCSHIAQLHGALPSKKRLPCRIKGNRNNKKFPWEVTSRVGQRIENRILSPSAGQSIKTTMIQHLYILSNIPRVKSNSWLLWHLYKSTEQSSLWEAGSRLANRRITRLIWDPACSIYSQEPTTGPCPEEINLVHTFMIYFNIILYICLWLTTGLFASWEIECCDIVTIVVNVR